MLPGFTQLATDRLAQLAQNAFDEEQYDLGVQCINQLASLGWHPTGGLIRSLFAVSLCTLPKSSSLAKGKAKENGYHPTYSRKVVETAIGPDSECINAATKLLEHLSIIAGADTIWKALVPGYDGTKLPFSDANQAQSNNSVERGNGEDNAGDTSMTSSILGTYVKEMRECKSVWQVLELGDMMQKADGKCRGNKRQEANKRSNIRNREGQDDYVYREDFDREAVWRAIDMMLSVLCKKDCSKLARLISSEEGDGRRNARYGSQTSPAIDLGEVFEVIHAGLAPASLVRSLHNDVKMSRKHKLAERYRRGGIAADLLSKLYMLMRDGIIDRQVLLRRTCDLLGRLDHLAVKVMFQVLRRSRLQIDLMTAGVKHLQALHSSKYEIDDSKRYKEAINRLNEHTDMTQEVKTLLQLMDHPQWLFAQMEQEEEASMMQLFWSKKIASSIDLLSRDKEVMTLLEGRWSLEQSSDKNRQMKTSSSENSIAWEKVAFATARRRASLQATSAVFILKTEILNGIRHEADHSSSRVQRSDWLSLLATSSYILDTIYKQTIDTMTLCCSQMSNFAQEKGEEDPHLLQDNDEEDQINFAKVARQHITACKSLCEMIGAEIKVVSLLTFDDAQMESKSRHQRSSEEMLEVQMSI